MSHKILFRFGLLLVAVLAVISIPAGAEQIVGNQVGWIAFHTNVDGVTIYVDGNAVGTTTDQVYTYTVSLDGSPSSMPKTAYATKSGYSNSNTQSLAVPDVGETLNYYFTLNPSGPKTGSIYVTSVPNNAMVYIDGSYVGNTPQLSSGISPGNHNVQITKTGYQEWGSTAYVSAGNTASLQASLTAVSQYGSISVKSSPSGASVYLDGNYQGQTPTVISGVIKGSHTLELNKAGYYEWSGYVTVSVGQTSSVYPTLDPIPSPQAGTLYISSTPGNAYIYLDGSYQGVTPSSGSYVIDNVNSGSHTVKLTLSGYQDSTTSVSVPPGGTATVSIPMTAKGSSVTTGTLEISSSPTKANVYIDNQYKGITPLTLSLDAGQYSVTFRLTGYTDSTTTATVNAGASSTIQGSLVPASEPTQSGTLPFAVIGGILAAALILAVGMKKKD
ncbi:hypothetical protein J2128_000974 [Methanomicrobium sp. W14]|uniref:PEGA domain-containing protein n=1 Tax=Methanomicrobium sp. W14 TaxID=2817839 RepID=UPI001AE857AB|nr:PEGA domain-containing protein [Methanomicrobium sp. W14]MBP2133053.1 hypothetical protein [Methanomicrobium sp. W14]